MQSVGVEFMLRPNQVRIEAVKHLLPEAQGADSMLLWIPQEPSPQGIFQRSQRQKTVFQLRCSLPSLLIKLIDHA